MTGEIDECSCLNCGSSSVKFRLIATDLDLIAQNADRRLAKGTIERVGGEAIIRLQVEGRDPQRATSSLPDIKGKDPNCHPRSRSHD